MIKAKIDDIIITFLCKILWLCSKAILSKAGGQHWQAEQRHRFVAACQVNVRTNTGVVYFAARLIMELRGGDIVYLVLKYINENLQSELTFEAVARHFCYSKWHFCDRFKQYTGLTFTGYVRHRRMQLAVLEIAQGGRLTDIVQHNGYDTHSGFIKVFLTEFG